MADSTTDQDGNVTVFAAPAVASARFIGGVTKISITMPLPRSSRWASKAESEASV
jgi:hypothetical protein